MAIEKLPVDYVQDVIDTSVTNKRRYKMITNTDGTISLDDVTTYVLKGSEFGMDDANKTNGTVNEVIDAVTGMESGTIVVGKASSATNAESATNAGHALTADSATNATKAMSAETATKLSTPRNINGVAFDGTKDITISDSTKSPIGHTHDDRYYTENEIDTKFDDVDAAIDNKSPIGHTHGGMSKIIYATEEPTSVADGEIVMVYEE